MTYCLAIKLDAGLVFCADSRTNAGPDQVSTYSKLHRFSVAGERQLVLLSAGNLATTQEVVSRLKRDLHEGTLPNLASPAYLSDIADYIGRLSRDSQTRYGPGMSPGFDPSASFIFGGQIAGSEPELYLIYPEGNHIQPSPRHPVLQIGEIKYGKPILDRIIDLSTPFEVAMRCALVSMDSTIRSSATVGPPIELLFLERDSLDGPSRYRSFESDDAYLIKLQEGWNEKIVQAFYDLPSLAEVFVNGD